MNFGESMFLVGFIQKTIKRDQFIKGNYRILPRKQCGKIVEDFKKLSTKADTEGLPCGAA